ncbi:MAG: ParB N-terminal domain-containing protein, partial [Thermoguttaceae bacterium]
MHIRDRIIEFRRVKASELRPHPKNWRTHPASQRDALRGVLAEIGYAGALLARQLPDGSLELIDGHLRAETTPEAEVPVLVLDLDEREAAKLLAVHDPLAGMAEANREAMADLLSDVETENEAIAALLDNMLAESDGEAACQSAEIDVCDADERQPDSLPEAYQVVVECG